MSIEATMKYFFKPLIEKCKPFLFGYLCFFCINKAFCQQAGVFLNEGTEPLRITKEINEFDTSAWKIAKLPGSALQIKFPENPSFGERQIYTSKGLQKIQTATYGDPVFNLQYQISISQVAYGLKMKDVRPLFEEEIQRYAINFGGYPVLNKPFSGDGYEELTFEIFTKPNKYIRGKLIYNNGYISSFLVSGSPPQIFSLPANYFFSQIIGYADLSAKKENVQPVKNTTPKKGKTPKAPKITNQLPWFKFVAPEFEAEFPIKPTEKIFKIENLNGEDYLSKNYFSKLISKKLNFVGSFSQTFNDNTNTEFIFNHAIQSVLKEVNGKVISENSLIFMKYPCKEYVVAAKKNVFRIRYYVAPNGFYQVLVKGTVKSIENEEATRFINNFKIN